MSEPKPKRKLETATAAPLTPPKPVDVSDAREQVLGVLYGLALEGNVSAAKLYLDLTSDADSESEETLTPEDALRLLQEQGNNR
ncbi:hypothetical protein KKH27_13785 [bacterium]|nr:hypothetical protein [bacterium]MBU1983737.1 hypothetical protein [bacterium]